MLSLSGTCRKKNGHFLPLLKSFSVNAGGAPNGTVIKIYCMCASGTICSNFDDFFETTEEKKDY